MLWVSILGEYPVLDERPRRWHKAIRQAGALFFVFVVGIADRVEASFIPRTMLEFAAEGGSAHHADIVSVFNPAHHKQSLVADVLGTNAFSPLIHNFVTRKIKVCGFTGGESYRSGREITFHSFIGALHRQPGGALKCLRESFNDSCWRAAYICNKELTLQSTSFSEQVWSRIVIRRVVDDDIADAQLWALRKNECSLRGIIRTSQIANLNDGDSAKDACKNCKDECIKRDGIISRPVPEYYQGIVASGFLFGALATFALFWRCGWLR